MSRPRILVLRGHHQNVAELRSWEPLVDRFEIVVGETCSNRKTLDSLGLPRIRVQALRDRLPKGRIGDLAALVVGDRYLALSEALAGVDVVHSAELGVWFSGQPARLKERLGFRQVVTVWETIPFLHTFRAFRGRNDRRSTLAAADLFLAATERARAALLLEGADPSRVLVSPPGIDVGRFSSGTGTAPTRHLIVSPGRLVWEKGHFDVLRAIALLDERAHVLLVGDGPEGRRLRDYARELGITDRVEIRSVPYDEMPAVFAAASCVVLASLPIRLWEEQFGMVLAEALAAGAPIVASSSGAIPEVLAGSGAPSFAPGDWMGLAQALRDNVLTRAPGERVAYDPALVQRYSTTAAAERLAAAYERVLSP